MKNTNKTHRPPKQTIYEYEWQMRQKAIETAQKHKDIKPTKYDLKH